MKTPINYERDTKALVRVYDGSRPCMPREVITAIAYHIKSPLRLLTPLEIQQNAALRLMLMNSKPGLGGAVGSVLNHNPYNHFYNPPKL